MNLGLQDVHVLVTGASGGIGFAITQLFLEHGARVTGHFNSRPGPLEAAQKTCDRLRVVQADVTDEANVKTLFRLAGEAWSQEVQVLILNHGVFAPDDTDLVDMELSQWTQCISVNLTGSFLVAREFLRNLRSPRPGCEPDMSKVAVVVIGSSSGEFGEEGHVDYACAKSALHVGLVRTLKYEITKIAPAGRVNAVAPGWVDTPMANCRPLSENKMLMKRTLAATPLNRIATTKDVANQVVLLASSKVSAHVTGTVVSLSGGLEGRLPPEPPVGGDS